MFGLFSLFAVVTLQARSVLYPSSTQLPPGRTLHWDAEDLEDKVHWSVTVGNEDDVEDRKINWGEITKIAGQVNQIGKVLGFDASEEKRRTPESTNFLNHDYIGEMYSKFSKRQAKDRRLRGIVICPAPSNLNLLFQSASNADDLNNFVSPKGPRNPWVLYSAPDDLENKKINWREITKVAGQVNQIGKVLGFATEDAEELMNIPVSEWNKAWQKWIENDNRKRRQAEKKRIMEEEAWRTEARKRVEAKWAKKAQSADFDADDAEELTNFLRIGYDQFIQKQRRLEAEKRLARKRAIMAEATKEAEAEMRKKYGSTQKK